ncbi:Y-family DNA polymerase [Thiorhodovibrio frisius]|uniref:Nucleotidyltransferase/DNA polymerase involved in DNA repair n=1 Tax=Thiorhodovibrio frisius TaxID=631362 RepID=H8Z5X6_9GAMM|nr:DNA polymerase Y family protein [Thiorhodovibrio frisius]EIC20626.1 nucleotidyltransferase/DNA polymerase involved in DNA repair [Thiorhodovibrio frisius]WPL21375.1 Nucleotidyltransferase/DNA polymerase involved in DNA repair [Thiorhodovibrio frisius]
MLPSCWLAVSFPALPLEVYQRAWGEQRPLAITDGARVIACNPAARAVGVRAGLARLAALALSAELCTRPRRPALERAALERLAAWALAFSDQVSVAPPRALVLEAGRSLKLFGGAQAFYRAVVEAAAALGYQAQVCMAPTPGGALLLAAWGCEEILVRPEDLRRRLAALPPLALGLNARAQADCQRMGLGCIGDLLALPRAGLALRFGTALVDRLEAVLGEKPDPRLPFVPPDRFHGELELPVEIQETDALIFACRRLLAELCRLLQARQAVVSMLYWTWLHAEGQSTALRLGSARPEADLESWTWLLRARLAAAPVVAPVRAIVLASDPFQMITLHTGDLFAHHEGSRHYGADLLDRLRARLGEEAVKTLALVDDHRPERAWRWMKPSSPPGDDDRPGGQPADLQPISGRGRDERPLWLLQQPLRLRLRDGCLWLADSAAAAMLPGLARAQPLRFSGGRERIETGWWDAHPVARDYFSVQAANGERFWVYRRLAGDSTPGHGRPAQAPGGEVHAGWYLHGAFGL